MPVSVADRLNLPLYSTLLTPGDNFATDAITEDNIIYQARAANKKCVPLCADLSSALTAVFPYRLVFMGDDTWMMLFPNAHVPGDDSGTAHDAASEFDSGYWAEAHPFESFNVKDLHSVDEGVLTHLMPTLVNGTAAVRSKQLACTNQLRRCGCLGSAGAGSGEAAVLPNAELQPRSTASAGDGGKRSTACNCSALATHLAALHSTSQRGWDVLVAHFLGVDHVGHTHGPTHAAMKAKLNQMDDVLVDVAAALPDDALLVVMGDHGMTAQGNHGGNTAEEVTAALLLVAKQGLAKASASSGRTAAPSEAASARPLGDHSGGYLGGLRARLGSLGARGLPAFTPRVKQVDIVPTLSVLLGLPIPFGNLGRLMPDLLYSTEHGSHSSDTSASSHLTALLHGLRQNAAQVMRFITAYETTSSDFSASAVGALQSQVARAQQLETDATGGSDEELMEAVGAYALFLESAFEECRAVWAQFDVPSMLLGVVATWLVAFSLFTAAAPNDRGVAFSAVLGIATLALAIACALDVVGVLSLAVRALGMVRTALRRLLGRRDTGAMTGDGVVEDVLEIGSKLQMGATAWLQGRLPASVAAESRMSSTSALLTAMGLNTLSASSLGGVFQFMRPIISLCSNVVTRVCLLLPEAVCGWPAEVLSSLVLFDEGNTDNDFQPLQAGDAASAEGVSIPGSHIHGQHSPLQLDAYAPNIFGVLSLACCLAWGAWRAGANLCTKHPRRQRLGVMPVGDAANSGSNLAMGASLPLASSVRKWLPALCCVVVFFRCLALFGNSGIEAELEVLTFLLATLQLAWAFSAVVHRSWFGAAVLLLSVGLMRAASQYGKLLLKAGAPPQHTPVWAHWESTLDPSVLVALPWIACILPGSALTLSSLLVPLTCNVCGARGVSTRHAGASFGRGLNGVLNAVSGLMALVAWFAAVQYWAATASHFPRHIAIALGPALTPAASANGWAHVSFVAVSIGVCVLAVAIFVIPVLPCCKPRQRGRFPLAATDIELEAAMKPVIPCESKLFALTSTSLALPLLALLLGPGAVPALLLLGFAAAATAVGGWTTVLFQVHSATMDGVPRGQAMAQALWPAGVILALAGPFAFHASGHATKLSALQYSAAFVGFETFDFWRSGAALALNTAGGHVMVALAAGPLLPARTWRSLRVAGVLQTQASFVHLLALACTLTWLVLARRHLMVWAIFAPKFIFELFFLGLWVLGVVTWLICGRPGGGQRQANTVSQQSGQSDAE